MNVKRLLFVLLVASNLVWTALYYWPDLDTADDDPAPICGLIGEN